MGSTNGMVLQIPLSALSPEEAIDQTDRLARGCTPAYVCFVDAHMLVQAHDNPSVRDALQHAHFCLPDGVPVMWCLRLSTGRGHWLSGPRTSMILLENAEQAGLPVGFYGGTLETLERLSAKLKQTYPELRVVYTYSPPFRSLNEEETQADLRSIRESGARLLFVGLGGPKQELWMSKYSSQLPCVLLGVGAALKVMAGEIRLPPKWIQTLGLTWVVRFAQEPRRLGKRIVYYLPRFIILVLLDFVRPTRKRRSEAICE